MMFPKPVKKEKAKPYNSFQRKKPKKELTPQKQQIFQHWQPKPSKADRGEFSPAVVKKLKEEAGGKCQACRIQPDTETHHVMPKGGLRSGRGVYQNGMRVCNECHTLIQTNEDQLQYWVQVHRERYGDMFWYDEKDWKEHEQRQSKAQSAEDQKRQRMEEIKPLLLLVTELLGRDLRKKEIIIIDQAVQDPNRYKLMLQLMQEIYDYNRGSGYGERFED